MSKCSISLTAFLYSSSTFNSFIFVGVIIRILLLTQVESIPIFFLNDSSSSSQYAKIITFKVGLFSAERLVSVAICSSANEKPTTKRTEAEHNEDSEYPAISADRAVQRAKHDEQLLHGVGGA